MTTAHKLCVYVLETAMLDADNDNAVRLGAAKNIKKIKIHEAFAPPLQD